LRPFEQRSNVDALECSRNNAEIRERRISAPNVGLAVDDGAELVLPGQLFERSPGIGDGDKVFAGPVALQLANAVVEVFEEGQALGGARRLARDQEERSRQIDRFLEPRNTFRDGRIENVQLEVTRRGAENGAADVRTQAAAAQAEHYSVLEPGTPSLV